MYEDKIYIQENSCDMELHIYDAHALCRWQLWHYKTWTVVKSSRSRLECTLTFFKSLPHALWRCCQTRNRASSFLRFLDHTERHTTIGNTARYSLSAIRTDIYLSTHNIHNRQTSIPPSEIETRNPRKWLAADQHLWASGHWDRHVF
jgi:hypothetical protein